MNDQVERLLALDGQLWPNTNRSALRLGWIGSQASRSEKISELERWTDTVDQSKILWVGLGMGSSTKMLADSVLSTGAGNGREITFVDSTNTDLLDELELSDSFVVFTAPPGLEKESQWLLRYLRERIRSPRRFAAISHSGSSLDRLATEEGFWRSLHLDPELGTAFSTLDPANTAVISFLGGTAAQSVISTSDIDLDQIAAAAFNHALLAREGVNVFGLSGASALEAASDWLEEFLASTIGRTARGLVATKSVTLDAALGVTSLCQGGTDPASIARFVLAWQIFAVLFASELGIDPFMEAKRTDIEDEQLREILANPPEAPSGISLQAANEWISRQRRSDSYLAVVNWGPPLDNKMRNSVMRAWSDRFDRIPTFVCNGPGHLTTFSPMFRSGPARPLVLQVMPNRKPNRLPIPGESFGFGEVNMALADIEAAGMKRVGRSSVRLLTLDDSELLNG